MGLARGVLFGCLFLGCAGGPTPFPGIDKSGRVDAPAPPVAAHAWKGVLVRDAVIRGDLEAARRAASELADHATRSEPAKGELVAPAQRVAAAQDVHEAAASFAALAERCGACHARIGGPRSRPALPPPPSLAVVPRMRRHQWAAARLWEGLVAPSDEAWTSGAQVLSDAPLDLEPLPDRTAVPEITALSNAVHDLGLDATRATEVAQRVRVYGALLDTCSTCHQRVGGGPKR